MNGATEAHVVVAVEEGVLEQFLSRPALGAVESVDQDESVRQKRGAKGETHSRQRFIKSMHWYSSDFLYHRLICSIGIGTGPYGSGEFSTMMGGLSSRTSSWKLLWAGSS